VAGFTASQIANLTAEQLAALPAELMAALTPESLVRASIFLLPQIAISQRVLWAPPSSPRVGQIWSPMVQML
jgi:hypothetical protein